MNTKDLDTLEVEVLQARVCPRYGAIEIGVRSFPREFSEQLIRQGLARKVKPKKEVTSEVSLTNSNYCEKGDK